MVGGNWAFGSPWSAAYRTLHINSYRKDMEFADFPMPAGMPDFPHHTRVASYFDAYVDHFDLRPLISLGTGVERVEPQPAVAADRAALARRYVPSQRHTIQIDMPQYLRALGRELAAGQRRSNRS